MDGIIFMLSSSLVGTAFVYYRSVQRKIASKWKAGYHAFKNLPSKTPNFRFGVVTDIQYADVDDCMNFSGTQLRKYRGSLDCLRLAVDSFNDAHRDRATSGVGLNFVLNLGDLIDGRNKGLECTESAWAAVTSVLNKSIIPRVDVVGNHELYNFSRTELHKTLVRECTTFGNDLYFSFVPKSGWRVVVLDLYEISLIGWPETHPNRILAKQILSEKNPNDIEGHNVNWLSGLHGLDRRFVPYNGAATEKQLRWLADVVDNSHCNGERIIVVSHIPILPGSCVDSCLAWNYEDILNVLHGRPNPNPNPNRGNTKLDTKKYEKNEGNGGVVAVLAGHSHLGGFKTDECGIHHITFKSPLEAKGGLCHAIIDVLEDSILIRGCGAQESMKLPFK